MNPRALAAILEDGAEADPEALAQLAGAIRTWWSLNLPLDRCLGLPRNAEAARTRIRDYWLCEAARHLPGTLGPWQRAEALREAVRAFQGHRWPCWHAFPRPPAHATELDACLWRAFRAAAGKMPGTARRLRQILG